MREDDAQLSDYSDIAGKERFQQTWNNCKQEIKELQHTQLTETCSAYHFLTQDLDQLPTIKPKTLKAVIKHFPEYKPLLHMQNDLLNNYQLVQGPPPLTPTTKREPVVDTSNHLVKAPDVFETSTNQKQETRLNVKISAESQSMPSSNRGRLINSAFFNASFQSTFQAKLEKTSERTSLLNSSLFFSPTKTSSDVCAVKEKIIDRKVCYANS